MNASAVWRIFAVRGLCSLAYGLLAVLFSLTLQAKRLATPAIGLLLTVSLAGDFLTTWLVGALACSTRWVFTHLQSNILLALVAPEEHTAAASVTSLSRSAGTGISPTLSGALLQLALVIRGLPCLLSGGLKVVYDFVALSHLPARDGGGTQLAAAEAGDQQVPRKQSAVKARGS